MVSHDYVDIPHNDAYLFVGRLAKEKGPDLFCEAITQLGLRGIVVGDGYMKEDLQKQYPNIMFTGQAKINTKSLGNVSVLCLHQNGTKLLGW